MSQLTCDHNEWGNNYGLDTHFRETNKLIIFGEESVLKMLFYCSNERLIGINEQILLSMNGDLFVIF